MAGRGLLIAGTASRTGKTTVALGISRALSRRGVNVMAAKSGPDYIDPAFHAAASGNPCVNLDGWAMSDGRLSSLADTQDLLIVEGAMGLFDGAPPDGLGSSAQLAKRLGLGVVLVVDATSMSQSVAAIVNGFAAHDPDCPIAGVILNNVATPRHEAMLCKALAQTSTPVIGSVRRDRQLTRPSRHLGLVQASEDPDIASFLDLAAERVSEGIDLDLLVSLAKPLANDTHAAPAGLPALGRHIAIARDQAFAFLYSHQIIDWRASGATISYFSPLADETPHPEADAVYLPGGYPELHGQTLARAGHFRQSLVQAAARGVKIYGECGGFMVLGQSIADRRGVSFPMVGLLGLETSFEAPRLHLGYRKLTAVAGPWSGSRFAGHEFHYATVTRNEGTPLFDGHDATGRDLGPIGLVQGSVSGSFAHIIDLDMT